MLKSFNNMPVTLQPIDSPRRDLEHKIVLASCLADYGIASIIGMKKYLKYIHSISKGAIWLGRLGGNDGNNSKDQTLRRKMAQQNTKLFYLHDEGAFYPQGFYKHNLIRRHPPALLDEPQTKNVLFWGEKQKEIYYNYISPEKKSFLITVGAPRLDLCKQKYEKIDEGVVSALHKKYGEFILFCSQFGAFNKAHDVADLFSPRTVSLAQYGFNYKSEAINHLFDRWHKVGNDFIAFVKLIQEAAFALPEQQIVVRPHPAENVQFYEKVFSDFPNIVVNNRGDIRPVVRAAKLVIHNQCTSGIESVLAGTQTINFIPNQHLYSELNREGLNSLPRVVHSIEQALEAITNELKEPTTIAIPNDLKRIVYNIDFETIPYIANHIYNYSLENQCLTQFYHAPMKRLSYMFPSHKKKFKILLSKFFPNLGKKVPLTHFNIENVFEQSQKVFGARAQISAITSSYIVISP